MASSKATGNPNLSTPPVIICPVKDPECWVDGDNCDFSAFIKVKGRWLLAVLFLRSLNDAPLPYATCFLSSQ